MNYKYIIIYFLLFFSLNNLFSQNTNKKKITNNGFYFLPTQLKYREINFSYEHFIKERISLTISMAYKIPYGTDTLFEPNASGLYAIYEYQYMINKHSNAIYFSISPSFYFDNRNKYFFQPELFNRFYWFDDIHLSYDNEETYRYNSIRSERNNVTGIKLLFGFNNLIKISENLAFNIKLYAGPGFRFKIYQYKNIDYKDINYETGENVYIPYKEENGTFACLSFNLGVKIGLVHLKY